ncbi:RecF/RecN/SMC protein [Clavulina sp. PMI_390]|nr:RecF/RecN/SMC protein [Clavulina sp. PMI_390]
MRQGKLSELIHNSVGPSTTGAKKKKSKASKKNQDDYSESSDDDDGGYSGGIDSCSVEVHFREIIDLPGPDAYKVVPNSKLVVARTAYRSNKSDYTINGKASSFTEVTTLLKDRGIDLDHKRFLILQGEVESIAQMKPKAPTEHEDGLLEYLEDIIGTSKYKQPIEDANQEVEQLNEDRQSKLNRLRHVEKEKSRLEAEKREVEDALRDQNALVRAQSLLAQYYVWQALKNVDSYKAEIEKLNEKLAHEVEKNKADVDESANLEAQYEERAAQYDVVRKETAKLTKDLAALEKDEVSLQEKKKHIVAKRKKLNKAFTDDTHAKSEADSTIETLSATLKKRKRELEGLEAELEGEEAELERVQDGLKDKTLPFQREIEAKQKDLAPWTAKINAKQAEFDLAESERAMLTEKATGAQAAVDEAEAALEQLRSDRESKSKEIAQLNKERKNLLQQIKEAEGNLNAVNEQAQKLRAKVSSARQKVDEAKASQAANTSQNAVLDSLTRLRASGRINGFHGRLGSLGTIPDKYDVAVSTACPALNNLVVDTVDQGQACIEYLRKQNVGRASFFVLEKLPADSRLDKIPTPENAPRLFDLIKFKDPKFAPAFYKGLGNTLVATDLDQANRLAYNQQKRWRVVTLEGQLFDTSGTMSGGGTKVARGGMSSKLASDTVEPAVMRQYEQDSEKLQHELDKVLAQRQELEGEVEALQRQTPQTEMAVQKLELDIQNADKRIKEDERRVKELSAHTTPNAADVKRVKALESSIATISAELDKLRSKAEVFETDIKALQDKILEIGGVRLRSQKAKVTGIKEQIDHINETITKAELGKAKAERDSEKLEGSLATASTTLEELEAEVESLDEVLTERTQDVANVRDQVEKALNIAESAKDDLAEMKAELDEKMVLINKFRAKELELKQRIQDKTKAMKEDDAKVRHWGKVHDELELHDIDDDDDDENDDEGESAPKDGTENVEEQPRDPAVKDEPQDGEEATPAPSRRRRPSEKVELEVYSPEDLAAQDLSELRADVATLEERVRNTKPNMGLLAEYRKREAEFLDRAKDLDLITASRDAAKAKFDQLRKSRLEEFMTGFSMISSKLKEMYQMITLGGNAELELVDSLDPFSEGIIFSVMPPKKSWKNISNLSGGEKTLSSLALVFALHVYKPTPLYFMDEIDAALDFRNVSIVANYIKDRTKNAQFIIISLRNDMFELSHRLIGIYKTSNATRSVSIDNHVLTPSAVPSVPPPAA